MWKTKNARVAKALLLPRVNRVFKKIKTGAIYYVHTYCFSETIHSTRNNKVIRKRTAITARIFTRGFENKV